ncbi:uncharacterized protein LOC114828206 [Galendromus occidentalis]|uniref:Uncharacterized protein LOC114828206 n=1 Tax=Galendromus occidentalis TaxID=34638 RepID=A0AAJ7SEB7_9ACAR|nr:uncharacterized protein LOC114828206 [Galendromus occidentalis]
MRKQHMALKALMMANKPVPANKMSPHFKALDEIFSKDPSNSPLNKALEKCLGGKVKVINSAKGITSKEGQQSSPIVVLQQPTTDERSSLGSAFSQYIAKLIDELDDDQKDEVQAYIISYIFSLKQQNRGGGTAAASGPS